MRTINWMILLTGAISLLWSCQNATKTTENTPPGTAVSFDLDGANNLAALPIACIQTEYPNKLGQVLGKPEDLGEPSDLHPAFYGCFDWHSAVHGHWSLVYLLKHFPDLDSAAVIKRMLMENINQENIAMEVAYFEGEHNKTFERTYGWAWVMKLAEELETWDDPLATELSTALKPLVNLLVDRYMDFLPKLLYPIRVGEHTNTAFGVAFAWDYANYSGLDSLKSLIELRSRFFYLSDQGCPLSWEPSGFDFLSPCFEEIDIVRRITTKEEFDRWIDVFMPGLKDPSFDLEVGRVSDRTDGKLVHLDGLNFSRAWVMYGLARQYPDDYGHLVNIANKHMTYSLPQLIGDSYEGGHWLASFALYALKSAQE